MKWGEWNGQQWLRKKKKSISYEWNEWDEIDEREKIIIIKDH